VSCCYLSPVTCNTVINQSQEFYAVPMGGASIWFKKYMQKKFRATYVKVDGKPRELVFFGGVHRGLKLATGRP
jgi:hypothetical protein